MRAPRSFPENRVLTEDDFAKMRELRTENPTRYTRTRLAKMFNCAPFLVAQQIPLKAPVRRAAIEKREEEHEKKSEWLGRT